MVVIYASSVTAFDQHFRSHVLWRSTKTLTAIGLSETITTKSKITDFDISVEVYENVFWFEIPVDNILEM